jgi:spermidine synthase
VVVTDVFRYIAFPCHLVTREFAAPAKSRLVPDGLYVTNMVDAIPDGQREDLMMVHLPCRPDGRAEVD